MPWWDEDLTPSEQDALQTITRELVEKEQQRRQAHERAEGLYAERDRLAAERERTRNAEWEAADDRAWTLMLENEDGITLADHAHEPEKVRTILEQLVEHPTYTT